MRQFGLMVGDVFFVNGLWPLVFWGGALALVGDRTRRDSSSWLFALAGLAVDSCRVDVNWAPVGMDQYKKSSRHWALRACDPAQ